MFRRARVSLLASATALILVGGAVDQSEAQNLNMTATIDTGCTVGTGDLDFDVIDSTNGGSALSQVTITFTNCLKDGAVASAVANATIDGGANGVGGGGLRQLQHDTLGDKIQYTLTEATNGTVAPGGIVPVNISGGTGDLTFDASIVGADVTGKSAGDYTDSVGITVSFL